MTTRSQTPTPAEIASWPAPNFVNPETRRPLVLGLEIPLAVLIIVFVGGRFYSRSIIRSTLGVDDWVMLAAATISIGVTIMTCVSTSAHFQTGYHIWDLRPAILLNLGGTGQMALATQILFAPICALTKISICLTYLRIFPSQLNRYFCFTMIGYEVCWGIAVFFVSMFQCIPIESYYYRSKHPNPTCLNQPAFLYSTAALNSLSDFVIFLWPVRDLWKVQIPLKQRLGLVAMFALGVIVCFAGVLRLWYTSIYFHSYDILYTGATLYCIMSIETAVGIMCGCLPGCKPLMTRLFPRVFGSTNETANNSKGHTLPPNAQSFPFQELHGVIVKDESFNVQYSSANHVYKGNGSTVTAKRSDRDDVSEGSEEWIVPEREVADGPAVDVSRVV